MTQRAKTSQLSRTSSPSFLGSLLMTYFIEANTQPYYPCGTQECLDHVSQPLLEE
jgi:hypothetical protein